MDKRSKKCNPKWTGSPKNRALKLSKPLSLSPRSRLYEIQSLERLKVYILTEKLYRYICDRQSLAKIPDLKKLQSAQRKLELKSPI